MKKFLVLFVAAALSTGCVSTATTRGARVAEGVEHIATGDYLLIGGALGAANGSVTTMAGVATGSAPLMAVGGCSTIFSTIIMMIGFIQRERGVRTITDEINATK